jgi:nuclear protein localization family protein 4
VEGGPKKINSDGSVVQSYDGTKGFRPGMRSLRSIKMNWTLGDFMEMDAEFEFKIKRQEKVGDTITPCTT